MHYKNTTEVLDTMYKALKTGTRTKTGEEYYYCEDGAPLAEEISDALCDATGADISQMDTAYEIAHSFLCESHGDIDGDTAHNFADSYPSVYTADRTAWLAKSIAHIDLVNEALEELGGDRLDIVENIALGMYLQARKVADALIAKAEEVYQKYTDAKGRLEEMRESLRAENISYGELAELQNLAQYIDASDVELREAAGVTEKTNN